ncbi:sodium:proton antiporter [Litorimonas cladophorae]|uniref:Sodium:proton antiporter n=1 Tax=Litorimonas cladophorae TaxID=1220491 RepID=A0A918KBY3_9PROT|nr:monovalent cation/H(+) antiporter subunit G [Litorimonas cladophorae]GGX55913.1 sodium:proton antiporter [Litorimonas cladophorae]
MSLIFSAAVETTHAVEHAAQIDWISVFRLIGTIVSMAAGLFFVLAGTVGVLRLPDFYTRLHAAGMTDTLGAELILLALIFQSDSLQMVLKLLLVAFFLFVTSPTATHAVGHAAYRAGLKPLLGEYRAPDLEEDKS